MRGNSYRIEISNFPPYISSIYRKKQGPVSAVIFKYNSIMGPFLIYVLTCCGWLLSVPKHEEIAQKKIFLGLTIKSISIGFDVPNSKLD